MTSLVKLKQLYLSGLTRRTELIGQRRSRISTFYTQAKKHGALLTTSLAGQDSPPIIVPFQLTSSQLSFSEMENTGS